MQLNRIQVFQADELNHHPENFRQIQRDFDRPRGAIATADGVVVARSVETPDEPFERLRQYPEGELFAHITGFFSLEFGADGVERSYNDELAGLTARQQYDRSPTCSSTVTAPATCSSRCAATCRRSPARRSATARARSCCSTRATAPSSPCGRWPSYDPNLLSSHDLDAARGPAATSTWPSPTSRCWPAPTGSASSPARRSRW